MILTQNYPLMLCFCCPRLAFVSRCDVIHDQYRKLPNNYRCVTVRIQQDIFVLEYSFLHFRSRTQKKFCDEHIRGVFVIKFRKENENYPLTSKMYNLKGPQLWKSAAQLPAGELSANFTQFVYGILSTSRVQSFNFYKKLPSFYKALMWSFPRSNEVFLARSTQRSTFCA